MEEKKTQKLTILVNSIVVLVPDIVQSILCLAHCPESGSHFHNRLIGECRTPTNASLLLRGNQTVKERLGSRPGNRHVLSASVSVIKKVINLIFHLQMFRELT